MYPLMTEQFGWTDSGNVSTTFSLAGEAFTGFEQLMRLNQQWVRTALAESEQAVKVALSGKTPLELWVHQANAARPAVEKMLAHSRRALEIVTHTQAELLKILDAQFQQQQLKLRESVEGFARNAPVGSEAAVTVLKSAVSMSGVGYESIHKAAMQAVAIARGNRPVATSAA
ncbi:TIGR01841 family phasin [Paraburkholderia sediminicola]|uniref:TIGR01841 family phasin n=1 Tax=Paraburkholderia rhynchosiae TaxID=487049 RepID=A0ACC7NQH9_9BURK